MTASIPIEHAPELAPIASALHDLGKTATDCVAVVRSVKDFSESQSEVFSWKERLRQRGVKTEADAMERLLLACAIQEAAPRLELLPLHHSVKALMRKEFLAYLKAPGQGSPLLAGTDPFVSACKIASLRRFVAGPLDWVISGLPRSWVFRMTILRVPQALWYIASEFGGFKPAFYIHVGPTPRNRSLVIPKEVNRAYYRMAKSLELQPEMKGILCASWFHDPDVLRDTPHLAALNEPYLKHGGRIVATLGPAPADSGFLEHNYERQKLYENGQFRPLLTPAMWPRRAAIAWAQQRRELDN